MTPDLSYYCLLLSERARTGGEVSKRDRKTKWRRAKQVFPFFLFLSGFRLVFICRGICPKVYG